jgi:SagB-type dehydrogenase family enzyme
VRYRRSRHLVCHWDGARLVVENIATGRRTTAPPLALELLHALDGWRSAEELAREVPAGPAVLGRALAALERHTLLERAGRERPRERLLDGWAGWSPPAAFLHFSTKDAPYVEHARGERALARQRAAPAVTGARAARDAAFEPLTPPRRAGEFPEVLLARRTWRRFARGPLSRDALSTLLGLTFGVQGWMDTGAGGLAPLKTSPSGGARHSIEAYVLARRVTSLAPGLYHYDAVRHGLQRLRATRGRAAGAAYLPRQPWFAAAPAVVLMTAVFPRVQWRYPHPRAYRVVLAEAGHLCQTFCLTATWLGLAPFCSMALADTAIERDLRVDGVTESVLYAAGVGRRPRGGGPGQVPR